MTLIFDPLLVLPWCLAVVTVTSWWSLSRARKLATVGHNLCFSNESMECTVGEPSPSAFPPTCCTVTRACMQWRDMSMDYTIGVSFLREAMVGIWSSTQVLDTVSGLKHLHRKTYQAVSMATCAGQIIPTNRIRWDWDRMTERWIDR